LCPKFSHSGRIGSISRCLVSTKANCYEPLRRGHAFRTYPQPIAPRASHKGQLKRRGTVLRCWYKSGAWRQNPDLSSQQPRKQSDRVMAYNFELYATLYLGIYSIYLLYYNVRLFACCTVALRSAKIGRRSGYKDSFNFQFQYYIQWKW